MDPKIFTDALFPINDECEKYGRKFRENINAKESQ
jgi:hypothetical protein